MLFRPEAMGSRSSVRAAVRTLVLAPAAAALLAGCQAQRQAAPEPRSPAPVTPPAPGAGPAPPAPAAAAAPEKAAPGERALIFENGEEKTSSAAEAEAAGYTLIDLSD